MRPSYRAPAVLASLALLGGCNASSLAQQPFAAARSTMALRAAAQTIALKPSSLTFGSSRSRPRTIVISGGAPPYSARQSNADVADIWQPVRSGRTWAFEVAAVAGGTTIVTIRDVNGATAALPVNQPACVPPTPEFGQIYPRSGATNVKVNVGIVYLSEPSSDPSRPYVHQFYARLVGSDGSIASGGRFSMTHATPPPGSATLPPNSVLVRALIPKLRSGITYRILYPTQRQPCIPPLSTGSFTT